MMFVASTKDFFAASATKAASVIYLVGLVLSPALGVLALEWMAISRAQCLSSKFYEVISATRL